MKGFITAPIRPDDGGYIQRQEKKKVEEGNLRRRKNTGKDPG